MKNVWRTQYPNAPLHEPAGAWFVNRKRELDLLWKWASSIPTKGSRSITGLRRTGKSSIMAKLYNRLYFEQAKVMPIYITFAKYLHRTEPMTSEEFVDVFFEGAVRSYLTFKHTRPDFQQDDTLDLEQLFEIAQELNDKTALGWFKRYYRSDTISRVPAHNRIQWAINFLKTYAYRAPQPMVIMIDEFQLLTTVKNVDDGRVVNVTGSFQRAAESWDAPLLVSGSSVSILREEALGGLLSGRFWRTHVGPLEAEHAVKMVFDLASYMGMKITEEFAEIIVNTTEGYPYSIESIMFSASPARNKFPDNKQVAAVVEFELTDHEGSLREHYDEEYGKYVTQLNGDNITRKILYWITNQTTSEFEITAPTVAHAMNIDVVEVQNSLNILHRMDIIQRKIAMIYSGPRDPLIRLYLNAFHSLDIDKVSVNEPDRPESVQLLRRRLNEQQGEMNRQTGHFTEIIMAGAVRAFDDRFVDGEIYFGIPGDVKLSRCEKIRRREGVITSISILMTIGAMGFGWSRCAIGRSVWAWLMSVSLSAMSKLCRLRRATARWCAGILARVGLPKMRRRCYRLKVFITVTWPSSTSWQRCLILWC